LHPIALELLDPLNYGFNFPALITISIAATRIYRSLGDFLLDSYGHSDHNRAGSHLPPKAIAFTAKTNRVPVQSITMLTEEVAIHKTYEQYQTSQIDYDVEKNVESGI